MEILVNYGSFDLKSKFCLKISFLAKNRKRQNIFFFAIYFLSYNQIIFLKATVKVTLFVFECKNISKFPDRIPKANCRIEVLICSIYVEY